MKKLFLLVVTLALVLTCCFTGIAYADTTADNYDKTFAYGFVKEFCEKFPDRKAGINVNNPFVTDENGNPGLQQYLKNKIIEVSNGEISTNDVTYQEFAVNEYDKGYNVGARLAKQGTNKQIIIGAHYDSDGEGANDNASGVAALLMVVNELSKNVSKLSCNVEFVLFDAEEQGFVGSRNYVANMSQTVKDNTLLMINVDCIANGDNLYVWCENKHTDLADLFVSKSEKIAEKPHAVGTFNLNAGNGYGYIEIPQNSDHAPFRIEGIPTALFFSGTYSAEPWNYTESENPIKNTMNSALDTFDNLEKHNQAEFVIKIETTADVIAKTVLDGEFLQISANQRSQLVNYNILGNAWWASLICIGALGIAVLVLVLVYYRKLQKRSILGTAEIKSSKVFTTPDAEDIFTFKK